MSRNKYSTFDVLEMPTAKGKRQECEICLKKFSIMTREHQCKRCYRSVCDQCGTARQNCYMDSPTKREVHKICTLCIPESEFIRNYIQHYKLEFGTDSEVSTKWLKKLKSSAN